MKRFLPSLLLILGMTGCSTTLDKTAFNTYINNLQERCRQSIKQPLDTKEEFFNNYLSWLEDISGVCFDYEKFDIIPDTRRFKPRVAGLYDSDDKTIQLLNRRIMLEYVTHEFGHHTQKSYEDSCLPEKYIITRSEATAIAFVDYIAMELLELGNNERAKEHFLNDIIMRAYDNDTYRNTGLSKKLKAYETIDELVNEEGKYRVARCIYYILRSENRNTKKTWQYLANHTTDEIYEEVRRLLKNKKPAELILKGYESWSEEYKTLENRINN